MPKDEEKYFWILTIETAPDEIGKYRRGTFEGTAWGDTHRDIYNAMVKKCAEERLNSTQENCFVLFWSLEENKL